jgi:hypothetical protein
MSFARPKWYALGLPTAKEVEVVKLICAVFVALGMTTAVASSQDVGKKSKTKITVEDGKTITVTGCVTRGADGSFLLSHAAGKSGVHGTYILAADDEDDLKDRVGYRVEIKGKAADKGDGKVKIESKSEVETGGDTRKRESKTEVEGDLQGLPFLGVKSIRTLATVCP